MTMKMESSEILEDFGSALPYLEKGEYYEDRNLASVRETLEVSLFLVALPCWIETVAAAAPANVAATSNLIFLWESAEEEK